MEESTGDFDRREKLLKRVQGNGSALQFVGEEYLADRGLVMAAVRNNGLAIKYAHKDIWDDKEIMLLAMSNKNGVVLQFASERLRADWEVVAKALEESLSVHWRTVLSCASKEIKEKCGTKLGTSRGEVQSILWEVALEKRAEESRRKVLCELNQCCKTVKEKGSIKI